ncbi:MAG: hypothetical protein L0Z63_11195 [Actinobacteria bacterium]|nr:hypothetical protein [Actinomycetota bacterium]
MSRRSPSKEELAKDNDRLRARIAEMKVDHQTQIVAKTRALEEARASSIIFELSDTHLYPHLPDLIAWLRKAADYASVLTPATGDGRSHEPPTPYEIGRASRRDRERITWINRRLDTLIEDIAARLREAGPAGSHGPICWQADCPTRGIPQSYDQEAIGSCITCQTDFGTTRYRPLDRTQMKVRPRCWTRDCPRYARRYDDKCPGCGAVPDPNQR